MCASAGHQTTTICAVHDGFVLNKSISRSPLGGNLLTQCVLKSVEESGTTILPRYAFKRVEKSPSKVEVQKLKTDTAESYR